MSLSMCPRPSSTFDRTQGKRSGTAPGTGTWKASLRQPELEVGCRQGAGSADPDEAGVRQWRKDDVLEEERRQGTSRWHGQ